MHKKVKDISGQKFGRLTILSYSHTETVGTKRMTRAFFNAVCECGKKCVVSGNRVQCGYTRSCGCLLFKPGAAQRELYGKYLTRSRKRGHEIELTFDEFIQFVQQDCFYCGCSPTQIIESFNGHEKFKYNGIDRWNNELEYVKSNIVPCCGDCNRQKLQQSGEEFLSRCQKIAARAISILSKRNLLTENQTCAY